MVSLDILKQVEFTYPGDDKYIYCIPDEINLLSHKTYSILGISGSGKSTILTLLAALHHFSQGKIQYRFSAKNAVKVTQANWPKMAGPQFWGNIGFSFQKPEMIRALNVTQNLELVLGKANTEEIALALFEQKEWNEIKNSKVWKLSLGQIQRLGIIRAFGVNQSIVFMDEPTNNLDKSNRKKVMKFIQKYQEDRSIVIVSHDKAFMDNMLDIYTTFEVCEEGQRHGKNQRILQIRDNL
jgi:putative ABC transport system ATP-binding protein